MQTFTTTFYDKINKEKLFSIKGQGDTKAEALNRAISYAEKIKRIDTSQATWTVA